MKRLNFCTTGFSDSSLIYLRRLYVRSCECNIIEFSTDRRVILLLFFCKEGEGGGRVHYIVISRNPSLRYRSWSFHMWCRTRDRRFWIIAQLPAYLGSSNDPILIISVLLSRRVLLRASELVFSIKNLRDGTFSLSLFLFSSSSGTDAQS